MWIDSGGVLLGCCRAFSRVLRLGRGGGDAALRFCVRVTHVLLCFGGLGLAFLCVRSFPVACFRVVVPLGVRHASC